jgi:hypothetical protein
MLKTEQYYELDEEIIAFFKKIELEFSFAVNLKYIFQANNKQKKLIVIKGIPNNYAVLLDSEVLVSVNDEFFYKFDEEIRTILIEQELDKIHINFETGAFKVSQPTLKTSVGIIKKHTYESIERANETERLLVESKKDKDSENKDN